MLYGWWRLVWERTCLEVEARYGTENRSFAGGTVLDAGEAWDSHKLRSKLALCLYSEDYAGAAAFKIQLEARGESVVVAGRIPREATKRQRLGDHTMASHCHMTMSEFYVLIFQGSAAKEGAEKIEKIYDSLDTHVRRHGSLFGLAKECGRWAEKSGPEPLDLRTLRTIWKHAEDAWKNGWPIPKELEDHEDETEPIEKITLKPLPRSAVKNVAGSTEYRFRSHVFQASDFEEGWELLNRAWLEEQERTAILQKKATLDKGVCFGDAVRDAHARLGPLAPLSPPTAAYKEEFQGRFAEDEHCITFVEERTWIEVSVEKNRRNRCHAKRSQHEHWHEQLYMALRAAHVKKKQQQQKKGKV